MLGTHNSLSFNKPQWWLRPFAWMARCQSLDIENQWKAGARYFDIRVKVKEGRLVSGHGLMTYDINVIEQLYILEELARMNNETCYIRFIMESNNNKEHVTSTYDTITSLFVHLNFLGLIVKSNWEYLRKSDYCIDEIHGYKFLTWKDFLFPKYWAKKYRSKNQEIDHTGKYLVLDFIEMYNK
jgi:hypothetical protein